MGGETSPTPSKTAASYCFAFFFQSVAHCLSCSDAASVGASNPIRNDWDVKSVLGQFLVLTILLASRFTHCSFGKQSRETSPMSSTEVCAHLEGGKQRDQKSRLSRPAKNAFIKEKRKHVNHHEHF